MEFWGRGLVKKPLPDRLHHSRQTEAFGLAGRQNSPMYRKKAIRVFLMAFFIQLHNNQLFSELKIFFVAKF
jgi:hypothetical protein